MNKYVNSVGISNSNCFLRRIQWQYSVNCTTYICTYTSTFSPQSGATGYSISLYLQTIVKFLQNVHLRKSDVFFMTQRYYFYFSINSNFIKANDKLYRSTPMHEFVLMQTPIIHLHYETKISRRGCVSFEHLTGCFYYRFIFRKIVRYYCTCTLFVQLFSVSESLKLA